MIRTCRHRLEAFALHLFFALLAFFPLEKASAIGGWLGRKMAAKAGRTKVALRNLKKAFPDMSSEERDIILACHWENLGRVLTEYPHLSKMWPDHVTVMGGEHIASLKDKPALIFGAHLGNWEVAPAVAEHLGLEGPLGLVYRAVNNPYIDKMLQKIRKGKQTVLIPKGPKGIRQIFSILKQGGKVAMLVDQKMNDGIAVPFFGQDAMTAPAIAELALKFDCPIIPLRYERRYGTDFQLTFYPPFYACKGGSRQENVYATMQKIMHYLEEWITDQPEQWLWIHNRWPKKKE